MAGVDRKLKSTVTDLSGKSWAELCDSSQSSQSQTDIDSPLKPGGEASSKNRDDDDELYDLVFKPVKKELVKASTQDDLSLTSFMNNVHMVTPVKQEYDDKTVAFDEDTICSPFVKQEFIDTPDIKPKVEVICKEENLKKDLQHAKRRLTSESVVTDTVSPERVNKVNKKSTEHKNIHDTVESPKVKLGRETDPLILSRRQKQIDFGKNTIGYVKYLEQVPKHERKKRHPKTPPKNLKYTRRAWDGLIKNWRVKLHLFDPDRRHDDEDDALTTGSSSNLYSLGSMTSLDSSSQASDSRPSTPPPSLSEVSSQIKRENHEDVLTLNQMKSKKYKTDNN
ncbi:histone RNA hairpin-binding protein [Acyrthosiphon pisum]|uniref:Histone RNA hairpin-binding protein RNA-binding domain-containing protein n=1 Tax=Acyrthosiphon pisum TaxID=7029 RepID=A0A8R2A2B4_ACYPI|nr:histone RNA hairpin-binding protein [Acyrthosiphon pisum]|eukprot:XP_001944356.1 PREDICTED: histone RNA hairpin-binding protein [Acyrthosiphon pisum]